MAFTDVVLNRSLQIYFDSLNVVWVLFGEAKGKVY